MQPCRSHRSIPTFDQEFIWFQCFLLWHLLVYSAHIALGDVFVQLSGHAGPEQGLSCSMTTLHPNVSVVAHCHHLSMQCDRHTTSDPLNTSCSCCRREGGYWELFTCWLASPDGWSCGALQGWDSLAEACWNCCTLCWKCKGGGVANVGALTLSLQKVGRLSFSQIHVCPSCTSGILAAFPATTSVHS